MLRQQIARCLSVLGHPLIVFPFAGWIALSSKRSGTYVVPWALAFFALLALGVLLYSWLQVCAGRWSHIDASHPHERRSLHGLLLTVFSVSAAAVAWFQPHARGVTLGLILSCFLIGAAMLASHWLKVSLHVAFLVFAAIILWQASATLMAATLVFTAAVGWSRVELGRHSLAEVLAGSGFGIVAGAALWFMVLQVWA